MVKVLSGFLISRRPGIRQLAHAVVWVVAVAGAGCAGVENPSPGVEPDLNFAGVLAPGEVRGERSAQVLGALEAQLLQSFPRASWQAKKPDQADAVLDVTVYAASTSDTRSSQEQRQCRRWSEPDKSAKDSLRRLLSRNCVDWQVRQIPCLSRRYELDVQVRARRPGTSRIIASDRRVAVTVDRKCGEDVPSQAALQAQAEREIAAWAVGLLRPALAELAVNRFPAPTVGVSQPPLAPAVAPAAPPEPDRPSR